MIKLFNKKTMVVYIILLVAFAILGSTLVGVNLHYRKEVAQATSSGNELTEKLANGLTTLLQGLINKNGDTDTPVTPEAKEPQYDAATMALIKKQNLSFGFMIASYCLTAVFAGLAIGASEYPKYLEGDKYKAKMKRINKAKKAASQNS